MQSITTSFLHSTIQHVDAFGSGHINTSYRVEASGGNYLLQRINHRVFPNVSALTANVRLVTDHLRVAIAGATGEAGRQRTLELIPTTAGKYWCQDESGAYWRMYRFLDGLVCHDLVETPEQAYAGARSYGHFLKFLEDFPVERLTPVIPDFHNILSRLRRFEASLAPAIGHLQKRVLQCQPEIKRVLAMADRFRKIQRAWDRGDLPTRVTHNDTKFNNVLLSPEGEGRAVVDLDTVMPGIVHFDYGDGLRTATAAAEEDEADLELVNVDPDKYRAFTEGYLSVTRDLLTPAELHYLPLSGPLLAYIMAVRFLTDYLRGDVYYKIAHPEHNLNRGRNQLRLVDELERAAPGNRRFIP